MSVSENKKEMASVINSRAHPSQYNSTTGITGEQKENIKWLMVAVAEQAISDARVPSPCKKCHKTCGSCRRQDAWLLNRKEAKVFLNGEDYKSLLLLMGYKNKGYRDKMYKATINNKSTSLIRRKPCEWFIKKEEGNE